MSGYCVFQAHDGYAADELCIQLPDISLLILNTDGTGVDLPDLIANVRTHVPALPVLHIGPTVPRLPDDVPTLHEDFTPDQLLDAVAGLVKSTAENRFPQPAGS
jgi:hypothetical protein